MSGCHVRECCGTVGASNSVRMSCERMLWHCECDSVRMSCENVVAL